MHAWAVRLRNASLKQRSVGPTRSKRSSRSSRVVSVPLTLFCPGRLEGEQLTVNYLRSERGDPFKCDSSPDGDDDDGKQG